MLLAVVAGIAGGIAYLLWRRPSLPSPGSGTPGWTKKHASQVWRSLEIDILPALGPRPIDEIQPREIMALIEGIEDRRASEIATRILQGVRAVFSRAVTLGYREVNPAGKRHKRLKPRKRVNRPPSPPMSYRPACTLSIPTTATRQAGWDCGCRSSPWPAPARSAKPNGPSPTVFRPHARPSPSVCRSRSPHHISRDQS